jgi:hypothetical protein
MYAADYNLVANPANRYSIGDRTPGVAKDADGGMTLYIQAASPGADKESNWLPCPAEGTWFLILRMYQPHDEVVQAAWRCEAGARARLNRSAPPHLARGNGMPSAGWPRRHHPRSNAFYDRYAGRTRAPVEP